MTHFLTRRRLAPLLLPVLIVGLARCSPTSTEGTPGGGGGGGGGGTPVRLNITGQPGNIAVGTTFSPPVRVVVADANFLAVTSSSAPVTLTAIGSTAGALQGITTRFAASGTAVMTDITLDSAGSYRLIATSPGLISDTSDQFLVLPVTSDTVTIEVGSDTAINQVMFRSRRNQTSNPAVDTIAVGGAVRWLWQGTLAHGVLINAPPVIYTSGNFTAPATTFLTINTAGTYSYVCSVHGSAMNGRIVVR